MKKRIGTIIFGVVLTAGLILGGCGNAAPAQGTAENTSNAENKETPPAAEEAKEEAGEETKEQEEGVQASHYVDIDVEDYGTITVALIESEAPETVKNFVDLVQKGFYDGLTFHRIMSGFMIQGGDPLGNGTGGSDKEIKGEFMSNGVNNRLSHVRGAISMARSQDPNSASSQFFIVHEDSNFLDGNYACFGYVTDGMDVVDKICEDARPIDNNGTIPKEAQPVIKSIKLK